MTDRLFLSMRDGGPFPICEMTSAETPEAFG